MTTTLPKFTRRSKIDAWPMVPVGQVIAEAQSGFASGERDPSGIIQLRMNNVDTLGRINWDAFLRVPSTIDQRTKFTLQPRDVLFNNTNSTELVGKSALFLAHTEPVVYSNHFTRLRPKPDHLLPEYLALWLQHQWQAGVFAAICNRWIGQSAVKNEKLFVLQIPLPPLPEQKRIAALLTDQLAAVDRARQAAEQQLAAADSLKRAYLVSKIDAQNWPTVQLQKLLRSPLKTGISKSALATSKNRCLTLSAVRNGLLDLDASKPVDVSDAEAKGNWLKPGVFYVVRGNGNPNLVGRAARAPDPLKVRMLYPDLLIEVDVDPSKVSLSFLHWVWDTPETRRSIVDRAKTSAGIYKINQANLSTLPIPMPVIEAQQNTANEVDICMNTLAALTNAAKNQLTEIEQLPASLLRQAFSLESHGENN